MSGKRLRRRSRFVRRGGANDGEAESRLRPLTGSVRAILLGFVEALDLRFGRNLTPHLAVFDTPGSRALGDMSDSHVKAVLAGLRDVFTWWLEQAERTSPGGFA